MSDPSAARRLMNFFKRLVQPIPYEAEPSTYVLTSWPESLAQFDESVRAAFPESVANYSTQIAPKESEHE